MRSRDIDPDDYSTCAFCEESYCDDISYRDEFEESVCDDCYDSTPSCDWCGDHFLTVYQATLLGPESGHTGKICKGCLAASREEGEELIFIIKTVTA